MGGRDRSRRLEVEEVGASIADVARVWDRPRPGLDRNELRQVVADTLDPEGPLAARKVFSRRDVIVAVAPALYGRRPEEL